VLDHVDTLIEQGFVVVSDELLMPTDLGKLASRYYLRLNTAMSFKQLKGRPTDAELLDAVASADEFADVVVRRNELSAIKRAQSPYRGPKSKVHAILNAYIERGEAPEVLRSDAWLIRQNALRLLSALEAFLLRFNTPESVLRARTLALRLEYGAPEELCPLLQLDGLGVKQASQLYAVGVRSPSDITPAMLSRLAAGTRVAHAIQQLPQVTLDTQLPDSIQFGTSVMCQATITNAGRGARVAVTVSANGLKMLQDTFYLAKGSAKTIPIGVYGSENTHVSYEARVDLLDCIRAPLTQEKAVAVTALPALLETLENTALEQSALAETETARLPGQQAILSASRAESKAELPSHTLATRDATNSSAEGADTSMSNTTARFLGRCKHCGGSLSSEENVITCDCGVAYKLPVAAEVAESACSCGLPKFKLTLFGVDVCIDRKCESVEDVIAEHFAAGDFVCPRCNGPLTVVRRKGIIVGCSQYYDGCKTAFLLPTNATIVGRCKCGLPKLQLKTKTRCLDTRCRA
jgi:hypothetical protein